MWRRRYLNILRDPVWVKVTTLSLTLFFVMLADAIISYWTPNLLENTFKSSLVMGLIISFQSIIGFGADLIFPTLLRTASVKRFIIWGILTSIATALILTGSTFAPWVLIFLLAMTTWGVYYEFLAFASHQFVADVVPGRQRAGAWGILSVFKNLAYFLGPLLGAWIMMAGPRLPGYLAIFLAVISLTILLISGKTHDRPLSVDISKVNLLAEIEHWTVLFSRVWPMVILSLVLGFIDATFWTVGAVYSLKLAGGGFLGSLFLPLYALPSLFMGFVVAKWGIYSGKKKMAEKFLLASGIFLAAIWASSSLYWILLMVLFSSLMLAITYPLTDAVYSDIVERMGRERKHLIGLTSSVINISYIIAPILVGWLASIWGERGTFALVGFATVGVATFLLIVTPKKIKLPQADIKTWD